jgi:hypothetical protein
MHLSLGLEGGDLALVRCEVTDADGNEIIAVSDNRVRFSPSDERFEYDRVPGRFQLRGPAEALLDTWMIDGIRTRVPDFGDEMVVALDAEVVGSGQIVVRGIWRSGQRALVVQDDQWVIPRSATTAMNVVVELGARIRWLGPVSQALFEEGFVLWEKE